MLRWLAVRVGSMLVAMLGVTVAVFALALGIAVVAQFPLSGILRALDWELFVPAVALSSLLLLALCVLFALYPSYQATRQDPVEALRYE